MECMYVSLLRKYVYMYTTQYKYSIYKEQNCTNASLITVELTKFSRILYIKIIKARGQLYIYFNQPVLSTHMFPLVLSVCAPFHCMRELASMTVIALTYWHTDINTLGMSRELYHCVLSLLRYGILALTALT